MAKDNWTVNAEHNKRCSEKVGLRAGTPRRAVGTVTISKTRAVESDYAMSPREKVNHTACLEILSRNHVAVE
jgi:hypothetical protein